MSSQIRERNCVHPQLASGTTPNLIRRSAAFRKWGWTVSEAVIRSAAPTSTAALAMMKRRSSHLEVKGIFLRRGTRCSARLRVIGEIGARFVSLRKEGA
jgi:hypothetical protein